MIECEIYKYKRIDSGLPINKNKMLDIFEILEKPNLKKCKNFINYILYISFKKFNCYWIKLCDMSSQWNYGKYYLI